MIATSACERNPTSAPTLMLEMVQAEDGAVVLDNGSEMTGSAIVRTAGIVASRRGIRREGNEVLAGERTRLPVAVTVLLSETLSTGTPIRYCLRKSYFT